VVLLNSPSLVGFRHLPCHCTHHSLSLYMVILPFLTCTILIRPSTFSRYPHHWFSFILFSVCSFAHHQLILQQRSRKIAH
jgi:hypothetical protein